jgi:hypothetical protein
MSGVPETEALDVVLRAAGGFVAVGRTAGADSTAPNQSRFGQITVLPATTGVPAQAVNSVPAPAVAPPAIFTASGAMRIIGADGQPVPDDQEGAPPPPTPPTVVPAPAGVAVPGMMPAKSDSIK